MLSAFAKVLLVATSLSPLLGAVAISQVESGEPWISWVPWLFIAALLTLICWLLFRHMAEVGQSHCLQIREFEKNDKEMLAFLLTYLLPFISTDRLAFTGEWITGAYVLAIIFLSIAHAGSFQFNPVMGLLGYHFYAIRGADDVSYLLISREEMQRAGREVRSVRLTPYIYLHSEDARA